jgi:hypothetical protein
MANDLAVCRDHNRDSGVIGRDQKSARENGIEVMPDISNQKQQRRRILGLGRAPNDGHLGQSANATIENDNRSAREDMDRACREILAPPEFVVRLVGCEVSPR